MTSAKDVLVDMVRVLSRAESYWVAKFLDVYARLPDSHQLKFMEYLVEEIGGTQWEKAYADPMKHRDLIVDIVLNFTGNPKASDQPNKKGLAAHIKHYFKSSKFTEAEKDVSPSEEKIEIWEDLADAR